MDRLICSVRLDNDLLSAVLARVAYRLLCHRYRVEGPPRISPASWVSDQARRYDEDGFPAVASFMYACAFDMHRQGWTTAQWRRGVVLRSRQAGVNRRAGRPWQRVPPCY